MTEPKPATCIPPGSYPVIAGAEAIGLLHALRDPVVVERAACAIASKVEEMRLATLDHVGRMEQAGADLCAIFAEAHEIRGLAGNAGLTATGRIANGLCGYLDALWRADGKADPHLVELHLDAIARAAHAEDEATRLGEEVADELAALVGKRLADLKGS
jgi:chemotaxis protein histidine kinase CheA